MLGMNDDFIKLLSHMIDGCNNGVISWAFSSYRVETERDSCANPTRTCMLFNCAHAPPFCVARAIACVVEILERGIAQIEINSTLLGRRSHQVTIASVLPPCRHGNCRRSA